LGALSEGLADCGRSRFGLSARLLRPDQLCQPLDELLDDWSSRAGACDEITALGTLDHQRWPSVEPTGTAASATQAEKLLVGELPANGQPVRSTLSSIQAQ
jgi:hypothetical protein